MTRGLFLSSVLHVAILLLFLLSPRPPAFDWDRADAIAVELVPTPEPPPEEPPVELPPEPEPEPVVEPEPTPPADVEPPEPPPVQSPPKKKSKPRYVFKRAPKRPEDEGPSLAERLRQRLESEEEQAEEPPTPETAPRPASSPTTEVHASDFPYAWYLNVVRTRLTDAWDPPGDRMIAGRANQVVVRFRIHRDGRVTDMSLDGGSGTPGLDASARRAVDLAKPFPPLPEDYDGESLEVAVRFTAEGGA